MRLAAEKDVLGDGQIGRDAQFLMHHADTGRERVARRTKAHLMPVETKLARVIAMHAGDDLHQRRLAGAVLADETMDLAGLEHEADIAQGRDAAEGFRDAQKLDDRPHGPDVPSCHHGLRSGNDPPSTACRRHWPW
jgi:hypothetical protein